MDLTKAIYILTEHNKWRRFEPPYDGIPSSVDYATHKQIGEAIDFLVARSDELYHALYNIAIGHGPRSLDYELYEEMNIALQKAEGRKDYIK